MKRGGPIRRKTPMKSTSPLRSTPPSDTPGKPVHRKTGKHVGESKAKRLAKKRSGGLCEVCIPGVCLLRGTDFHHRLFQSQGGKWDIVDGLFVCRSCHMAITNTNGRRGEYEAKGWIVPSHGDPATTEVLMWHDERQGWFLLREDGTAEQTEWPAGDPRHPDDIPLPETPRDLDGVA